jgi:threonine/homoserine/homoserine lactone efflux protein
VSPAFLVTAFVVVATPGTGALLSIAAGLRSGPRRSLVTAFGCTLGIIPHLMATITGAAALLRAGGLAFDVVKLLGVGYLLFMAWSMWRDTGVLTVQTPARPSSPIRTIISAVLANLLNPKLTIFFFACYGAFAGAARSRLVERPAAIRRLERIFSLTFVGLAGKLATTSR